VEWLNSECLTSKLEALSLIPTTTKKKKKTQTKPNQTKPKQLNKVTVVTLQYYFMVLSGLLFVRIDKHSHQF
jgi:hypothetical protein